jgi:hypothetical protein
LGPPNTIQTVFDTWGEEIGRSVQNKGKTRATPETAKRLSMSEKVVDECVSFVALYNSNNRSEYQDNKLEQLKVSLNNRGFDTSDFP